MVDFHLMRSSYGKCGLKFFIKDGGKCGSVGKRLEKFPLISQLASQRSLDDVVPDDDEDPIVNCHPHLSLFL